MSLPDLTPRQPGPLSVLVVGGGIGGLTAAIALRRNGHRVSILDKTGLDSDSGAALHLCPNASGILRQWGIRAEEFGACLMSRFVERTHKGKVLKDIDLAVPNARPVRLLPCHRVVGINPLGEVVLEDGKTLVADVVLGADGIASTTRQAIKKMQLYPTGKAAFRFVMPRSAAEEDLQTAPLIQHRDTLTIWFADDRRVIMYPCNDNRWLNFVCIHPDTESHAAPATEWNRDASLEQALRVFKDFDPSLRALFTKANPSSIKVWQLMDMDKLPTWTTGTLALLGDAAHPCLPYQSQGGAQAIEDAAALATVLPQGTTPEAVPKRLELYEVIRSERAHKIQEYSRLTGQNWVDGKPVVDMRAFEEYNFGHDEIAHASAVFREWQALERSAEQSSSSKSPPVRADGE